jgi:hypothetical protein
LLILSANIWQGCYMAIGSALTRGVRTLTRRDFWTFKVVHAVLGGLLTVAGACGGILVTEQIRKQIADVDSSIADNTRRVDAIERALYQFQLLQTQGVLLGALSAGDGMREEFRRSFMQLGFLVRKGPTARMIQELNSNDLAAFRRERDEHEKLVEAALPADDKSAWDALLKFEMDREGRLRDLHGRFLDVRYALAARRRELDGWLNTATIWGFILQQLGFVIVLLAGLVHQHGSRGDITANSYVEPSGR